MKNKYSDAQLRILEKEEIACDDVVAMLDEYVAQEMPDTLNDRLEDHVSACEFCEELDQGYRLTIELAAELAEKPIPVGVQNRLRKALNERLGLTLASIA